MGYEVRDVFDILEKELTDYFLSLSVEKQTPLINKYYNTITIIKLTDCLSDDQMENFYKKVVDISYSLKYNTSCVMKDDKHQRGVAQLG